MPRVSLWREVIVFLSAVVAGGINSIAGGGTLITFPTLLWIGRDPIVANATNTVALWPGSLSGAYGFRRELASARRWLALLILPSLAGGAIGAWLLLRTSSSTFSRLVPFLILGATLLLAFQELITRRIRTLAQGDRPTAAWLTFAITFQFGVGIYGGYFGAGIGILMLAALGLIGLTDLHQMNGVKNVLALCINGIAAIWFAISGKVMWTDAALMAVASILGGYLGARAAQRLGRRFVRAFVVTIGFVLAIAFFVKR